MVVCHSTLTAQRSTGDIGVVAVTASEDLVVWIPEQWLAESIEHGSSLGLREPALVKVE
jgi:hypothetical protein